MRYVCVGGGNKEEEYDQIAIVTTNFNINLLSWEFIISLF